MDITQQPLVSDVEIQQLLNSTARQHTNSMINNRFSAVGEHPSEVIGTGMDFADRQPYVRGDDTRHIDWRASARSQQTLTRRYHTELSTPCCVVIDRRDSMLFGTKTRLKVTQAVRAGIKCGAQFLKAGQQLGCLVIDEKLYWQSPSNSLLNFNRTAKHAARACPPKHGANHQEPLHWSHISDYLHAHLTQGSQLVLISDFSSCSDSKEADHKALRYLSQQFNLSLLCVQDEAERQIQQPSLILAFKQLSALAINRRQDLEHINQQLSAHQHALEKQFKKLKCVHQFIDTSDELKILKVI